jgi:hypothetical protein
MALRSQLGGLASTSIICWVDTPSLSGIEFTPSIRLAKNGVVSFAELGIFKLK